MTDTLTVRTGAPFWLTAAALLGAAWNAFGIIQLTDFTAQTRASLMMSGMSPDAARLYYGLPSWMTAAFAVGSVGGLLGCVLLFARRSTAVPVFALSLAGYVALFIGDYAHGVFGAIPGQLAVLVFVVVVAAALFAAAWLARGVGLLKVATRGSGV